MFGIDLGALLQQYNNPQGFLMLGAFATLVGMMVLLNDNTGKLSTGRTVGTAERLAATSTALKQLRLPSTYLPPKLGHHHRQPRTLNPPSRKPHPPVPPNRLVLWAGKMPQFWWGGRWRGLGARLQTLMGAMPALWLPDAQRSVLVLGNPGSGKTASAIDPMVESALAQGIPVLLYDKKGDQMRLHAPLAARYGYQVHVFAPGEPYSGVLNPIEFLRDSADAVMAGELGAVITRNAQSTQGGRSDEFFTKAGEQLAKGLMQLARDTPFPDMAMVYAFLQLPDLVHRLDYAVQTQRLNPWVAASFNQFLSAKGAEKTVSGIITTTAATFSSFIQRDLLPSFVGSSTIPARIQGKQIIIFKLDDARRSVIGPLLAAAIHLCVVKNLSSPRPDPIAIAIDKLPSLRLDRLPQWINEYRSNGGCFILGVQSLNQLYDTYGDKMGEAISAACGTHFLFNPGDIKTAELYSKRFGEKDVALKQRSRGRTMAARATQSINWNESLQKMPLFTPDQILRFIEGQCIITNPAYRSGHEGLIPYSLRIPLPKGEIRRAQETTALWEPYLMPYLTQASTQISPEAILSGLRQRIVQAEQLLPEPPGEGAEAEIR
ncbi:type IV secretory system conjugative DNA transfer family protein [Leptolyngbya sp. PCC 6406]|uniref:type IV secretory system conjugative DNA transfer family protein n=1 Tax=Leptolyngbya sp. PCC 6406 TaxID=1173264 RepID=UPI0002AC1056|nr:type IV secretion system DNA-binding domain-containing protein [Leptolyngbya sp. PCC 6406]